MKFMIVIFTIIIYMGHTLNEIDVKLSSIHFINIRRIKGYLCHGLEFKSGICKTHIGCEVP